VKSEKGEFLGSNIRAKYDKNRGGKGEGSIVLANI